MHVLVTCRNKEDPIKMKELECSQDFSHNKPMGIFPVDSAVHGRIWSNFDLVRNLMAVLVTCKNEEDSIKNEGARVATRYVEFSDAQGQITQKSVVGSGRNSNSFKFLWMCLLSVRMKEIQSKMNSLEWHQHFSYYNSKGIFQFTQVQLTPQPLVRTTPKFELCPDLMVVLL